MSELAKWYVVHTYSGYENKVATNLEKIVENHGLQEMIWDVKVPTETVTEIKDNKAREVERKIFPSYVLVKMIMTDETWYIIRNIRGVTGFVGPSSKPIPLTDEEVAALNVGAEDHRRVATRWAINVKIMDGPLSGFYRHRGRDEHRAEQGDGHGFHVRQRDALWSWSWIRPSLI